MYLSRRLNRSLAPPDWLSINLTLRCNLRCVMCTTCYEVDNELSTREILDIVDQAALMGIRILNPLGGEPLLRPDLEEILTHAASKDFYITLTTNGTLLDAARARGLARIPPEKLHVTFSLDGPERVHDQVRGEGVWARALKGFENLREADLRAGNPRRKILANTILHRHNLEILPEFLDRLAALGFDGVQILTLFRSANGALGDRRFPARPAHDLHIGPEQLPLLDHLIPRLLDRVERPPHPRCPILNEPSELLLLPAWARGELQPLDAPCWAGWKELYVNADGRVLLCDGKLDFLEGAFGSTRLQTLQELWSAPELRVRREVIKRCRTPCAQTCYLRPQSKSARLLGEEASRLLIDRVRPRLEAAVQPLRRALQPSIQRVEGGILRLELTDVCDCDLEGCLTPPERFSALIADIPEPIEAARRDPSLWTRWRDRHLVDFGRGFMGFELVRSILDGLLVAGQGYDDLCVSWRGEPLLHPEILAIYRHLLSHVGPGRLFGRLSLETRALFLGPELVALARQAVDSPQEWRVDLDRLRDPVARELAWEHLRPLVDGGPRLLFSRLARMDGSLEQDLHWLRARFLGLPVFSGRWRPGQEHALWLQLVPAGNAIADRKWRRELLAEAEAAGASFVDLPPTESPYRCLAAERTPTVSWDGKVVLCPWDTGLENRVGEVTKATLPEITRSVEMEKIRRDARYRGVPGFLGCRDCHRDPATPNPLRRGS